MKITRIDFLKRKLKSLGYNGIEKRYGCKHWCLKEWARYDLSWTASKLMMLRKSDAVGSTHDEMLDLIKRANRGINMIATEYEKAIAPLGRSVS